MGERGSDENQGGGRPVEPGEVRQETRTILERFTDAFFTLDQERRFVYVNAEAERFWGKPRDELLEAVREGR